MLVSLGQYEVARHLLGDLESARGLNGANAGSTTSSLDASITHDLFIAELQQVARLQISFCLWTVCLGRHVFAQTVRVSPGVNPRVSPTSYTIGETKYNVSIAASNLGHEKGIFTRISIVRAEVGVVAVQQRLRESVDIVRRGYAAGLAAG